MTTNTSVVEQIVRSLSFEVIAVPTEKVIQSSTSKSTLNVKIKVKKKDKEGLQYGVIATPNLVVDSKPQRIRLVSSDHTVMSFNVVMEDADLVKPASSRKPVIPTLPIYPGTQDTTNPTYKADIQESRTSQSDGALKSTFILTKVEDNKNLNSPTRGHKKDIFGHCKPGGCLDPPFGEDKYSYAPAHESLPTQETLNTAKPRTSSLFTNKLFKKKKKAKSDALKTQPGEQDCTSILSLYEGDSLKASATLSNSLITYPSILNENDIKQKLTARNESVSKKSVDINNNNSGSLYIIPRKNKISTELKYPPFEQKDIKTEQNPKLINVIPPVTTDALPVEQRDTTDFFTDKPDSPKEFQRDKDFSETSYFDTETTSLQNDYTKTTQNKNGAIITGIVAVGAGAGAVSMIVAGKDKSRNPEVKTDKTVKEITSLDGLIDTKTEPSSAIPVIEIDKSTRSSKESLIKQERDESSSRGFVDDNIVKAEIPSTLKGNTLVGYAENINIMDNESGVNNVSSDILLNQNAGNDKIIPLKGQALTDFKYDMLDNEDVAARPTDEMDVKNQINTVPESNRSVKNNEHFEDLNTNKVNKVSAVDLNLQRDLENNKDIIEKNDTNLEDKISHHNIMPLKGQGLGEEFNYDDLGNEKEDDMDIHNQNRKILESDQSAKRKDGKETKDFNITSEHILKDKSSHHKIMPLKGQGLGEEVKYDNVDSQDPSTWTLNEMDNQNQAKTVSASDQTVQRNTMSKKFETNKRSSISTVDIDLQRDWINDKETIDFNVTIDKRSSDILQDDPSHLNKKVYNDKLPPLKGHGLDEPFQYNTTDSQDPAPRLIDETENPSQTRIMSESSPSVKTKTALENFESITLNRADRVVLDSRDWNGKETTDSNISVKKSSGTLHDVTSDLVASGENNNKSNQNDIRTGFESDQPVEKRASKDFQRNKLNTDYTVNLDLQSEWKDGIETIDFNFQIDGPILTPSKDKYSENSSTKNGLVQTQSQQLLNKNVRDSSRNRDENNMQTNNESSGLDIHTPTDSLRNRNKTGSSSIVSILKDKFDVNTTISKDKISKENESLFSNNRKKSPSKTEQHDKYLKGSDIYNMNFNNKARDYDNGSKRSKSSVSFDNMVFENSENKLIKSTAGIKKPIKIDLGFHSYTTDSNEVILKSFDSKTVLNRHPKDAIVMTSCNVRDPFELKVPIDNDNLLWIQIKNNAKDDSNTIRPSVLSKYSDRRAAQRDSPRSANKTIRDDNKHADVTKLSNVYEKVYESEFVQFQEMIKKLKQEVDILINQQNALKENLLSKRMKQFKMVQGNKRCCCSRKI